MTDNLVLGLCLGVWTAVTLQLDDQISVCVCVRVHAFLMLCLHAANGRVCLFSNGHYFTIASWRPSSKWELWKNFGLRRGTPSQSMLMTSTALITQIAHQDSTSKHGRGGGGGEGVHSWETLMFMYPKDKKQNSEGNKIISSSESAISTGKHILAYWINTDMHTHTYTSCIQMVELDAKFINFY